MAPTARPVRFAFETGPDYPGVTHDGRWNGFLVVGVTPETLARIVSDTAALLGPQGAAAAFNDVPRADPAGVIWLDGYVTTEVHLRWVARRDGSAVQVRSEPGADPICSCGMADEAGVIDGPDCRAVGCDPLCLGAGCAD